MTYIQKYATINKTLYLVESCPMQKPNACVLCCNAEHECNLYVIESNRTLCDALHLRHDEILVPQHSIPSADDLRRQSERLSALMGDK